MPVVPPTPPQHFPDPAPGGIGQRLANGLGWIVEQVVTHLQEAFGNLGTAIAQRIADVHNEDAATAIDDMRINEAGLVDPRAILAAAAGIWGAAPAWLQLLAKGGIVWGTAQAFVETALKRVRTDLLYAVNRATPTFRISAEDGVMAERRRALELGQILSDLADEGVDPERAEALIQRAYRWLTTEQIRTALWREKITPNEALRLFQGIGLPDDQVNTLLDISEAIPSISDLQHFITRHIFDPDGQGLFANPGPGAQYHEFARKLGFKDEVADLYWLAHWTLIPPGEAVRILHRLPNATAFGQPFDRHMVSNLLRFQEIHPGLHDAIIDSSWSAPSAFMIRGMIESGAITPERATEMLTWSQYRPDFIDDVIGWAGHVKTAKVKDVTSGNIVAAYKRHLIDHDEAAAHLTALRYDDADVEQTLSIADYDISQEDVRRRTAVIKAQHQAGSLNDTDAAEQLLAIGKPPQEVTDLLDLWDAEHHSTKPKLTRAEAVTLYKGGTIEESTLRDELDLMGWDPRYRDWFIEEADSELRAANAKKTAADLARQARLQKHLTKADLAEFLKRGIITDAEFTTQMLTLGYTHQQITEYAANAHFVVNVPQYKSPAGQLAIAAARERFRKGITTQAQFTVELAGAGTPDNLIPEFVSYELAAATPTPPRPESPALPEYRTAAGRDAVQARIVDFRHRRITQVDLLNELRALGETKALAQAVVALEAARLLPALPNPTPPVVLTYKTPAGKIEAATLRDERRKETITDAQLLTGLIALQMPSDLAAAIVAFEAFKTPLPGQPGSPEPTPVYKTPAGRIEMAAIREEFRKQLITVDELTPALLALGAPADYVDAIVDYETARTGVLPT